MTMDMISEYNQQFSIIGAFLILLAYMGQQFKWKALSPNKAFYNVLNTVGGTILALVALNPFVAGFFVMELIWTIISLTALIKVLAKK